MFNVFMDDYKEPPADKAGWLVVRDLDTMIHYLEKGMVNNLSLDHDMGDTRKDEHGRDFDGTWLMKQIAERNIWPKGYIVVHSENPIGARTMAGFIKDRHQWEQMHREQAEKRKKLL